MVGSQPTFAAQQSSYDHDRFHDWPFDWRSGAEFVELLTAHGIELLADVRQFAASRRNPQFAAEELTACLGESGIAYVHLQGLGGRRRPQPDSPNTYWRHPSFRAYADYMATDEFAAALDQLLDEASRRVTAIMCAEAVPWRCHRQLIADTLVARGVRVLHILGLRRCDEHPLNPHAELHDGHLVYQAAESQGRLFEE